MGKHSFNGYKFAGILWVALGFISPFIFSDTSVEWMSILMIGGAVIYGIGSIISKLDRAAEEVALE
jgi:hypothetical protein